MNLASWTIIGLFVIVLCVLAYIINKIIQNERKKKVWIANIKSGDECRISQVSSYEPTGEIIKKVDEDHYEIKLIVNERWIYPVNPSK